jgi:hypothetical protein
MQSQIYSATEIQARSEIIGLTGVNGIEQISSLLLLLDVCINEKRVGLGVDILHHDLEAIEAASLGDLNLSAESLDKVLVNDTIRRGEEGKDMRDEVALIIGQTIVPVVKILG